MSSRYGLPDRRQDLLAILVPPIVLVRWRVALRQFLGRAIARQYRVTTFGFLWSLLVPFVTLAIYGFVFGVVVKTQWDADSARDVPFVLTLFTGLLVFWLMAQSMGEACGSIVQHTNLVKKTVFPLEIIPVTVVGTALFQAAVNTAILIAACAIVVGHVPLTAVLFPVVLAPFLVLLAGIAWFLAALGVYFRDLGQVIGLIVTGAMFLSPVLYPMSRFSPRVQELVLLNPLSYIVLQGRRVLLEGQMPSWHGLALYFVIAWSVASLGFAFFSIARKSFADVL